MPKYSFLDRELSWLSFSERVLQEAEDPSVPLLDRLFFCGIFSSNLDEFFRVRVAVLRSLLRGESPPVDESGVSPHRLLHEIHQEVFNQQERYGRALGTILDGLRAEGVELVSDTNVPAEHQAFVRQHFDEHVRTHLKPVLLNLDGDCRPFLRDRMACLVVETWSREAPDNGSWTPAYALVEVPSPPLPRFLELPADGGAHKVMFLDDVIRFNLPRLLPEREVGRSFAVKLNRDADLLLADEFEGDIVEAIRGHLKNRETGIPSRFLYDMKAPYALIHQLQHGFGLAEEDLVLGGRYHNLHDYMGFPRFGRQDLSEPEWPALPHPELGATRPLFEVMRERDRVVHTPYQSFDHVVRLFDEAASDPDVEEVWLTVYRVARDSAVLGALCRAAESGKKVTVFMEVQARFDEATNLAWADRLEKAGARIFYPLPGLKVHAKIALVARREAGERRLYAYVGTGNFNEKTARIYADHGIFTADERITVDVEQVFRFLVGEVERPETHHLLVAPFTLRDGFGDLIAAEAAEAEAGRPSGMTLKMNSLEDAPIIKKLYKASRAGVPIRLIVRGICRLLPGVEGQSETIQARSIVDRFLEHARIYIFHDGGQERMYLASADLMKRNLSRRIEVAIPVYDPEIKRQVHELVDLQWADNRKARMLGPAWSNAYVERGHRPGVRSQEAFRDFVAALPPAPSAGDASTG